MELFQINFIKNNGLFSSKNKITPKGLIPLYKDTVTFSANKKDYKYSTGQKEKELASIRQALLEAIKNGNFVDAEKLSDECGLDIYVVKLRLSTNSEIRNLYSKMQVAYDKKNAEKRSQCAKSAKMLFETLANKGHMLTDSEISFYLGIDKKELSSLLKDFIELAPLCEKIIFTSKNTPLIEKSAQIATINKALRRTTLNDTYDDVIKRINLPEEAIRARLNENEKLFNFAIEKKFYPIEIYSDKEIEEQEDVIMNAMLSAIKRQKQADIWHLAQKTGLFVGTIKIRLKNNEALKETYQRFLGMSDED